MNAPARRQDGARRTAVAVLLATLVALLALVAAPTTATATVTATTATPSPDTAATLPLRVQVTAVDPTVLQPGEDLVVRARVTNTTGTVVPAPRVNLRLERIRPGTREDLRRWLDDEPADSSRVGQRVAGVETDAPLVPGASVEVELTVPASDINLLDRPDTWGARGMAVDAAIDGRRAGIQRTFLLWATESGDFAQARVSLLAPLVGPAPVPDDVDVTPPGPSLSSLVASGGRLDAMLRVARSNPDVALVVDPATVARARSGSESASSWAQDVAAASTGRDVVALPWADPDLAALAHAGAADLLAAAVETSADAAADAGDGGRRLSARTDVLWAPGPVTDQATADLAAAQGAVALVLAPGDLPSTLDAAGARVTLTTPTGTLTGLVPDATLTTLLADPDTVDPDATTATVVQRVLAELAVLARSSDDGLRNVLVALPRDAEPDPALLRDVLDAVQSAPWSRTAPLTALLGSSGTSDDERGTLPALTTAPDELPVAAVQRLQEAWRATATFADVTEDPDTLLAGVDATVLAPVSVAWRADPPVRETLVTDVVAQVDARRVGLSLAQTSTQRFVSADNTVRFSVRNELPTDAQVRVVATPRKACVRAEPSAPVVVRAGGEETVPVAVHAIANCEVVMEATLTSADGVPLAEPVTFVVRASPTIESVGTAIVGVLLAVGLVLGIIRTVRRGQSARRGARLVGDEAGTRPLPVLGGGAREGDA